MKRAAIFGLLLPLSLYAVSTSPALTGQMVPRASSLMLRNAILRVAAPNAFIKLTLPDGSEGRLQANQIIRIRRTIASENERGAKTRIDWIQTMLVRETPEAVVALVGAALPSLGKLLMPDRSPLWFNALAAEGPLPLTPDQMQDGVQSGMVLGRRLQYLANTPQEVQNEITNRGGTSLPLPAPFGSPGEQQARARSPINVPKDVWDSDVK